MELGTLDGDSCIRCEIPQLPLAPGRYFVLLGAGSQVGNVWSDAIDNAMSFDVAFATKDPRSPHWRSDLGPVVSEPAWRLEKAG